jgi:hypothetical protein
MKSTLPRLSHKSYSRIGKTCARTSRFTLAQTKRHFISFTLLYFQDEMHTMTMNYSHGAPYVAAWNHAPSDALTSQMRLCSISESKSTTFQSSSDGSLSNGWGNSLSRKSYKMDLSSLAGSATPSVGCNTDHGMKGEDEWGFFIDS